MWEQILGPWPWYVVGPLIGLMVPLFLIIDNKSFGVSSNLRHICAACIPANIPFFQYNWKAESWNLFFIFGIVIGGYIGTEWLTNYDIVAISEQTVTDLQSMGITNFSGLAPAELFSWGNLTNWQGVLMIAVGGFMVGFGTRYAGGCTSGHAITGLSNLQWPSLVAVIGFFVGGLFITHVIYPIIY